MMKVLMSICVLLAASLAASAQCTNGDILTLNTSTKLYTCVAPSSLPVSSAQQTAIDSKANTASPTFTGTVGGITASMVGLGNVTNTSDANKPVSTAQQTALDLKAPLASPTFTGTVTMPSTFKLTPVAIASLPTCNAGATGNLAVVTDALLPAFLASVAAGGSVKVPVFCNGSAWVVY
jgi:hypothetical protein